MARPKSDPVPSLRNRSRGTSHGKAIARGLRNKVLETRMLDLEKQLDRLGKDIQTIPTLRTLISGYDDVVESLLKLIPTDLNKTHGPLRRTILARAKQLFHEAEKAGVPLHVD